MSAFRAEVARPFFGLRAGVNRLKDMERGPAGSYETADFIYNPLHYLALLEQKTKALDQAAPLDNWRLADCVHRLRRLMEARMGNAGRREFIQVLRLMEDFHQHQVEQAVSEALRLGAISFDAVKMLLLARLENRPARLARSIARCSGF
jgi:hypothetical protein